MTFDIWFSYVSAWICLSYPAWSLLSFVSFIRFEFSPIISSDSLPAPFSLFSPSKTPIVCMFTCWMIFLRFHSLCPLQFFSFVFLWSIIDIVLSSHWLHCWNVSLNPSGDVSFQLLYFSALKEKGFGFLLDYLSYLLISAFCWYIISLTFPTPSFSCLIMNTVVLISFSRGSAITFFRDNVYWFFFLFWMGHTFLFLCMPCNFFVVENWTLN